MDLNVDAYNAYIIAIYQLSSPPSSLIFILLLVMFIILGAIGVGTSNKAI